MSSNPGETDITDTTVLTRQDGELLTTVVDGELIGMSVEQGACYGFNGIGTHIWDLLEEPRSLDDLIARLTNEYEVEADTCRQEVLEFVQQLRAEGLVTVSAG